MSILTQYQKVRDQTDTIESLGTKLKYDVKDKDQLRKDQLCNLPLLVLSILSLNNHVHFNTIPKG